MAILLPDTSDYVDISINSWIGLESLVIMVFFLGFAFFRYKRIKQVPFMQKKPPTVEETQEAICSAIEDEVDACRPAAAISTWRITRAHFATPLDTLEVVAQAFIESDPKSLVGEIVDHMQVHAQELSDPVTAAAVLETLANAGEALLMEDFIATIERRLDLAPTPQMLEIRISGHAMAGDAEKVESIMTQIRADGKKVTSRSYALAIRGFLKNQMLDAALRQAGAMRQQGLPVPPPAVNEMCNEAARSGGVSQVLDLLQEHGIKPSPDAVTTLCDHCAQCRDVALAHRVEEVARSLKAPFSLMSYDALLKLYSSTADPSALTLFQDMQKSAMPIGATLRISLLERSAATGFADLAREVVADAKSKPGGMTCAICRTALLAYAACAVYVDACDLYVQATRAGLELDQEMLATVARCAAECSRTELLQELASNVPV